MAGETKEPVGLLGESGLISAVLVVAVIGRCGIRIAIGAVCSCGMMTFGGEIFPCTNVEFSNWTKELTGENVLLLPSDD